MKKRNNMRNLRKGDLVKCIDNVGEETLLTIGNYYVVQGSYFANVVTKGVNIICDNGRINGYINNRFELANRKVIRDKTINNILK